MTTKLTPQQKKTIRKVTEALKDSMISMTIDDLVSATGSSPTVIKNTLAKIEGVKQDENGYYLPRDDHELNAVAVNIQEAPVNMQDKELNTQDSHVSYHDDDGATLINTSATLINTSAEVVSPSDIDTDADQSSNGQAIETVPVAENEEEFELQPPPIATKHYVLIENCTLSLTKDGTGQEPVLAKDIWVDDEGEELEESDCLVMKRARMPFIDEVEFRGVTYRNLFIINNAQIFHGVFDSIKTAHDKLEELTAKKRGNLFQVLEV